MWVWPPLRAGTDDMIGARSTGPDGLQHEVRHRRERAGVARADHAPARALLHEVDREAHRGILAAADRIARMLGHARRRWRPRWIDTRARTPAGCAGERGFDDLGLPDEDELEGGIGGERAQCARNALRRTAVATHHIDGD